jgi:hypothetical protein
MPKLLFNSAWIRLEGICESLVHTSTSHACDFLGQLVRMAVAIIQKGLGGFLLIASKLDKAVGC